MTHFLAVHVHWLWAALHWLHHDVFSPWSFVAFVLIAFTQTYIAWEGAELALKALPPEQLGPRDRKRYVRLTRILAGVLFIATIFIGVVNDRGQKDADEKTKQAQADQTITQSKLDEANERARHADEAFQEFAKTLDPSKLTVTQYALYVQAQRASAQASKMPPATPITSPAPTPIAPPTAGTPSGTTPPTKPSKADLISRLESMRGQLFGIDQSAVPMANPILRNPRFQSGALTPNDLAQLRSIYQKRNDEISNYLPQTKTLITEVWEELNLTPSQIKEESDKFDAMSKAATAEVPQLTNTSPIGALIYRTSELQRYLMDLESKLNNQK